jgi:hypothetical protein
MHAMKRKPQPIDDDDRLTPDEERGLARGIAQSKAGLTYGPFEKGGISLQTFLKRNEQLRPVAIEIPTVLFDHLKREGKRFGMTPEELMVTILKTHQFKNRDRQMIMLAVDRAARRHPVAKRSRKK